MQNSKYSFVIKVFQHSKYNIYEIKISIFSNLENNGRYNNYNEYFFRFEFG